MSRHSDNLGISSMTMAAMLLLTGGCATQAAVTKTEPPADTAPAAAAAEVPKAPAPVTLEKAFFAYDHAELSAAARLALKHDVDELLAHPELKVNVEGNCDERGTDQYNLDLGWKRAYATRDYLARQGIPEDRLFPISYGRSHPAVVGDDEAAWSKNRRVDLSARG